MECHSNVLVDNAQEEVVLVLLHKAKQKLPRIVAEMHLVLVCPGNAPGVQRFVLGCWVVGCRLEVRRWKGQRGQL